ncbi:universal stress protein [Actinomadura bangladeshensis]|uniref:Universal stress protein n=1 Tax=Actinomadura bangladeshensis TaxID=453573 RepID=A0A4R4P1L6_9ACTN|nr:universal stress protein [Actinomadura bangladeshensis]TDC16141.1 universal stress protein [Actinomadura bangladeshensis]
MSAPIVVGTDGSGIAERAVDWAAADAARRHRPLHIVHAAQIWPYQVRRFTPPAESESVSRAGRAVLVESEKRVRTHWPGLRVTTALQVNAAPDALRDESEHAFELVVGQRGRGGFAGLLLGSVSLRVAGHSAVPVVVVRGAAGTGRGEVAVGYDIEDEAGDALEYAFDAAAVRGARLRVVHAWQISAGLAESGYSIDEDRMNDERRGRIIADYAPLHERYPLVEVVNEVLVGHPVSILSGVSRAVDLLVVGASRHRRGVPRLGSVGHGVIHHAECPVAVVGRFR